LVATVCGVILAAPLLRLALILLWPGHPWAGFSLLPCRADSLMLGVLGAIAMRNPDWRGRLENNRFALRLVLGVLGLGLLVLTKYSWNQHGFGIQTIGFTWLALFYVSILLYALTARSSWISAVLRWKPLGGIGTIAYGAYLYHAFIMWCVFGFFYSTFARMASLQDFGTSLLVILITFAVCRASWSYFEKPLLQIGQRWRYQFDFVNKTAVTNVPEAEPSVS
jgi:peptidoglycan/LPS O-acetylase OafA/YrhL